MQPWGRIGILRRQEYSARRDRAGEGGSGASQIRVWSGVIDRCCVFGNARLWIVEHEQPHAAGRCWDASAVADAQSFPSGQVQFTATGTFSKPPSPSVVTFQAPYSGSWFSTDPVTLVSTGNGTAIFQCIAGKSGTFTITAVASNGIEGPAATVSKWSGGRSKANLPLDVASGRLPVLGLEF